MKRPNFQRMMKDVHQVRIQTIVCYRLDRLTRNTKDCFEFAEELEHCGASFISMYEKQWKPGFPASIVFFCPTKRETN